MANAKYNVTTLKNPHDSKWKLDKLQLSSYQQNLMNKTK